MEMNAEDYPWSLRIGVHEGHTLTKRPWKDNFIPCKSFGECVRKFTKIKQEIDALGLQIWFARAEGPDNQKSILDNGVPYKKTA